MTRLDAIKAREQQGRITPRSDVRWLLGQVEALAIDIRWAIDRLSRIAHEPEAGNIAGGLQRALAALEEKG